MASFYVRYSALFTIFLFIFVSYKWIIKRKDINGNYISMLYNNGYDNFKIDLTLKVYTMTNHSIQTDSIYEIYRHYLFISDVYIEYDHNFNYIINPAHSVCSKQDIFLLIYVHTSPANYKRRLRIRDIVKLTNFDNLIIKLIFILGMPSSLGEQSALDLESSIYGDLIESSFIDTYRNLTHKAVSALLWISRYCILAKFILKLDDDVFVNFPALFNYLKRMSVEESSDKLFSCLTWIKMMVVRNKGNKWYVTYDEYADKYYTIYCSGSAFIFSRNVAISLLLASLHAPFIWVDDYYLTGRLPLLLGIRPTNIRSNYLYTKITENIMKSEKNNHYFDSIYFVHVSHQNHLWDSLRNLIYKNRTN